MKYTTLGIMIRNKCTAECDTCSVECSPKCNCELDLNRVKEFIDSCQETSIQNISITGGEPFIDYEELLDLVSYSSDRNFNVTTVTNGFWANDYNDTLIKLNKLKGQGLGIINISHDNYHSKFVSVDNVNNIIKACNSIGLPYVIAIVKTKNEKIGSLVDKFSDDIGVIKFLVAPCEPVGKAKQKFTNDHFSKNVKSSNLICPYEGVITLCYDGRIFPCCSHYIFKTKLSVGDYRQIDMPDVLAKIRNNGLLYIMRNYGLDPILNMNKKIKLDNYLSSPCEACYLLFNKQLSSYLPQVKEYLSNKDET